MRLTFSSIDNDLTQVQKRVYRKEKKKAAKEILTTLRDPSVVLMADYLKVRGMLKSWTKFWCVLKPGVLILYKSQKQKVSGVRRSQEVTGGHRRSQATGLIC